MSNKTASQCLEKGNFARGHCKSASAFTFVMNNYKMIRITISSSDLWACEFLTLYPDAGQESSKAKKKNSPGKTQKNTGKRTFLSVRHLSPPCKTRKEKL